MITDLKILILNYLPITKLNQFGILTNHFWHIYLSTHYKLINKSTNFDAKAAIIKINNLLQLQWQNHQYPSWRYPSLVIDDMAKNNINYNYPNGATTYTRNTLVTAIVDNMNDYINIDIIVNENLLSFDFDNDAAVIEYSKIIKIVSTPTYYLTPLGSKSINFDIDKANVVVNIYDYYNDNLVNDLADDLFITKRNAYVLAFT